MKDILVSLLVLFIPLALLGQEHEYKSKEMEDYKNKRPYEPFSVRSEKEILNFKSDFFRIEDVNDYNRYSRRARSRPNQDSLIPIILNLARRYSIEYSISQFIGFSEEIEILKCESRGPLKAFLFLSSKYETRNYAEPGIWVAYSSNNGLEWKCYYTGIVQNQPLFVKWYSKAPLFRTDNTIQIEASLMQQVRQSYDDADYKIVKDGLILTMDLSTLMKDTDNDGLTDVVEKKFFTNINNADTDGDGINDNLDLNPRKSEPRTETTAIFEYIMNYEPKLLEDREISTDSNQAHVVQFATNSTQTFLIVSDDPGVQSIQFIPHRVIILSEKEYSERKSTFENELNIMTISPLFRVDGEKDTYIFSYHIYTSAYEYLVKKTEQGWTIKLISYWVS